MYKILESYLNDRKQYTTFLDKKSNLKNVLFGVPQGSILGPLLFILYINDIDSSLLSPVYLYADDTVIKTTQSTSIVDSAHQNNLEKTNAWLKNCKLTLNNKKTKTMTFSRKKKYRSKNCKLGGTEIEEVSIFK